MGLVHRDSLYLARSDPSRELTDYLAIVIILWQEDFDTIVVTGIQADKGGGNGRKIRSAYN